MPLSDIPAGTDIHNIELKPNSGGKIARSAGSSVILSGFDDEYAIIKLSSGETRKVRSACKATIGTVSNPDQKNHQVVLPNNNEYYLSQDLKHYENKQKDSLHK